MNDIDYNKDYEYGLDDDIDMYVQLTTSLRYK